MANPSKPAILTILRRYAQINPSTLPTSILLTHTDISLTVFDVYPKSIFHFLILPRIIPPLTPSNSASLRTLLHADKNIAKTCLEGLAKDAGTVKGMIEDEMLNRFGFKWPVWMGFHAIQSMEHLHLHIISADLCSLALKTKKHYNSFHPQLGFFLHLDDVLSWLEAEPSFFKSMIKLDPKSFQSKLKEPLECFHCAETMKNIPTLKVHLQKEWDKLAKIEKAKEERKARMKSGKKRLRSPDTSSSHTDAAEPVAKRRDDNSE